MDTETYRGAADQAWKRITNLTVYGQYTVYEQTDIKGFWHQGNALLTCLDYLLYTNQQDNLLTNPDDKSIVKNAIQWVFVKHLFNTQYQDKQLWPANPSNPNWPIYPWDPGPGPLPSDRLLEISAHLDGRRTEWFWPMAG